MLFCGDTLCEQLADAGGSQFSQLLLVGLGIVVILAVGETLTVANHPHFSPDSAEDDGRGRETFLGMVDESLQPTLRREGGQERIAIATLNIGSDSPAELMAADVGGHMAYIAADKQHGVSPVAHPATMSALGLGGAAVDDGDEVICDDEAVLAFLRGILWDEALFEDCHD